MNILDTIRNWALPQDQHRIMVEDQGLWGYAPYIKPGDIILTKQTVPNPTDGHLSAKTNEHCKWFMLVVDGKGNICQTVELDDEHPTDSIHDFVESARFYDPDPIDPDGWAITGYDSEGNIISHVESEDIFDTEVEQDDVPF